VRFLIFSQYQTGGAGLLLQRVKELGHTGSIVNSLEAAQGIEMKEGAVDVFIPRFSHSTYRRAHEATKYFEKRGTVSAVSAEGILNSFDKYLSTRMFIAAGIPIPSTELVLDGGIQLECSLTFPRILKPVDQNRGQGIVVAHNPAEYEVELDALAKTYTRIIAQTFMEESKGHDTRVFVVGGRVVACMERWSPSGSNLSNLAQGGKAKTVTIDDEEAALAIKAAKMFQAKYCGVDIIKTKSGPMLLEANLSPGFKAEEITGVAISRLVIENLTTTRSHV
jgi:ribosomal protein S6--L-glutamate ligase